MISAHRYNKESGSKMTYFASMAIKATGYFQLIKYYRIIIYPDVLELSLKLFYKTVV
jgi:hypothetical protein